MLHSLGLNGSIQPSLNLAAEHFLTRQRIWQIVRKSIATTSRENGWATNLSAHLRTRLERGYLPFEEMAASEWAKGLTSASIEAIAISVTQASVLDLPSVGKVVTYLRLVDWKTILQDFEASVAGLSVDDDAWQVIDGPIGRSACSDMAKQDARAFLMDIVEGRNLLSLKFHHAGIGNAIEAILSCHDRGVSIDEVKRLLETATHHDMKENTIRASVYERGVPIEPGRFVSAEAPRAITRGRWNILVDACLDRLASKSEPATASELSMELLPEFLEMSTVNVERILLLSPLTMKDGGRRWKIRDGVLGPNSQGRAVRKHAPWSDATWAFALERWQAGDRASDIAKALGPAFNKNKVTSKLFRAGLMRKPRETSPSDPSAMRHGPGRPRSEAGALFAPA